MNIMDFPLLTPSDLGAFMRQAGISSGQEPERPAEKAARAPQARQMGSSLQEIGAKLSTQTKA